MESGPSGKSRARDTNRDGAFPSPHNASNSLGKVRLSSASVEDELSALAETRDFEKRYEGSRLLARGGMGEIRLCHDGAIGRDVAMKVLRPSLREQPSDIARLLREARVQGQLEHPAVAPVYDLGVDPEGSPYFTMKRLKGTTLARILKSLREAPREQLLSARRKLLTEFVKIGLGLDYAHSQGVVHRDLKPSNLMLGDFGEVYVLDWGIAKIDVVEEPEPSGASRPSMPGTTEESSLLGTPGYVAPEQLQGVSDRRSDVYSLGAILFELLTLVPLHVGDDRDALLASMRKGADARTSARAPEAEVPPALEDVCLRATAQNRSERFESVRSMVSAIERYLDGDGDLERRRELASEHADRSATAARRAEGDDSEARSSALREASRALALDPDNTKALGTLAATLLKPPAHSPPEVEASLDLSVRKMSRFEARIIGLIYLGWLLLTSHWLAMSVKNLALVVTAIALIGATAVSLLVYSRLRNPGPLAYGSSLCLNTLAIAAASLNTGPFLLVPGTAAATTFAYVFLARGRIVWSVAAAVAGCAAVLGPYALQAMGVFPATTEFQADAMVIQSQLLEFEPGPTERHFLFGSAGVIIATAFGMLMIRRAQIEAQRKLHTITWQLRQLVPEEARSVLDPIDDSAPEPKSSRSE